MSTILDEPNSRRDTSPTQRLRTSMAAVRVGLRWFGIRKSLTTDQKARAADTFGAEEAFLSAGKKLLDTRHPAFKTVTAVRSRLLSYAKSMSLPYPEPGIRLIRHDRIDEFDARMREFQDDLDEAVRNLDEHYGELRATARDRLGTLYNSSDYPESLIGLFAAEWDFPAVEPPNYLRQLNPEFYEQESRREKPRNALEIVEIDAPRAIDVLVEVGLTFPGLWVNGALLQVFRAAKAGMHLHHALHRDPGLQHQLQDHDCGRKHIGIEDWIFQAQQGGFNIHGSLLIGSLQKTIPVVSYFNKGKVYARCPP